VGGVTARQPEIVAMAELIDMLGVSKSWVVRLVKEPDFPAPLERLRVGQIWSYQEIAAWAQRTGRTVHPIPAR
jgi:predicted DNA-binding transcriptional regulator AlpA